MTLISGYLLLAAVVFSQAEDSAEVRQDRMRFFREQGARHVVCKTDQGATPLAFVAEPVLRFSNPSGPTADAAIFVWLAGARPQVLISFSIRRQNDEAYRECTSFSGTPLDCQVDGRSVWSPKSGSLKAQRVPDAPVPAESRSPRLTQMRDVARRFSGRTYNWRESNVLELRLLPTPIYRFEAEKEGVIDGAIFSIAKGTDPEVLLLLEAIAGAAGGNAFWQYSLARMSSMKQVVQLDDNEIWSVPLYSRGVTAEEKRTGHYNESSLGRFTPAETDSK